MELELTSQDRKRIEAGIRGKYTKVAVNPNGLFQYPTGPAGLEALNYDTTLIRNLPEAIAASYCGVGNPFSLGPVNAGESVLDIGCGSGVDTLLAAMMAGPTGKADGVDIVPEMLQRAEENLKMTDLKNVSFQKASGEKLPFKDNSFDVVISNGVINLIPDKAATLKEAWRVLKPGGRLMIADQILAGDLPSKLKTRIKKWSQWEGGAIPGKDFLALLKQTGFGDVELVAETGFNSSPKTKATLFRATKPLISVAKEKGRGMEDPLSKYQEFFKQAYAEGALDRKTKHLIALGASLAAGCEAWTRYCLAVARELGATREELREAMAIAMTVGATKIQILQDDALASLTKTKSSKSQGEGKEELSAEEACSTWASWNCSGWAAELDRKRFAMPDESVNILLFLAQGFEDLEAVAILDVFGWTQYSEHIPKVSVTTAGFHEVIRGRFGLTIRPDIPFSEIDSKNYQALVLPGGFHNHGFEEAYDSRIHTLGREVHQNGGYLATMCVGILPIADAGLVQGKEATTYPHSRKHDNIGRLKAGGARVANRHVVMDERIISCDGPGSSLEVAFLLMECLIGPEMTQEVQNYMIFTRAL